MLHMSFIMELWNTLFEVRYFLLSALVPWFVALMFMFSLPKYRRLFRQDIPSNLMGGCSKLKYFFYKPWVYSMWLFMVLSVIYWLRHGQVTGWTVTEVVFNCLIVSSGLVGALMAIWGELYRECIILKKDQ